MQTTELHLHTHYSTLDGLNTPAEYCKRAAEIGMDTLAITDHGTLAGHRDFQDAARDSGIKPILGVEAYFSTTDRFDRRSAANRRDGTSVYNHVTVLAMNQTGLKNLHIISEKAWTEGFYFKPRTDLDLLSKHSQGIIVMSGCLNGPIAKAIEANDEELAVQRAGDFKEIFGDRFYIEVQSGNPAEMNHGLLRVALKAGVEPVMTGDCHYAKPEDLWLEEALLIISTNPKAEKGLGYSDATGDLLEKFNYLYPDRRMTFKDLELFLGGRESREHRFEAQGITDPRIYDNTNVIASRIGEYEYFKGVDLLPKPRAKDPYERLRELVYKGLRERGLHKNDEYVNRVGSELKVIKDKNFSSYFLITANTVHWAKENGIMVGPGRGSAAGSLVCYALGITLVDPIKYNLLFFRFIDPGRDDWPDIDIDFQDTERWRVKDYVRRRFGNVAGIGTFNTFSDKNSVKDAARVLGVPYAESNAITEKFETFEEFLESNETREFRKKYPEVEKIAGGLIGRIRGVGIHAGGLVVSKEEIAGYAPIETREDPTTKERVSVTGFDMDQIADIGLIKMDYLGLTALSVISDTLAAIEKRTGKRPDLENLRLNDSNIFSMLSEGDTVGVFQAEATPYTALLTKMKVRSFDELAASNALVRPGAMNTIGDIYMKRKDGIDPVEYAHPIMMEFTNETYGLVLYQEQVMLACTKLAGMTMGEANRVRKIIGKKKDPHEFDQFREKFITGASQHISKKVAEALWHDFEAHAGYSFNKSHAVAYSMLTYWTAWLKYYYPVEFMWAILKNEDTSSKTGKIKIVRYLIAAKKRGIRILLPDVNKSDLNFTIEGEAIRFGLRNIKFISDKTAAPLLQHRPFTHYSELLELVNTKNSGVNERTVSALNKVGAARMPGNERREDVRENLWEYLNVPHFDNSALSEVQLSKTTPLEYYNESDVFVSLGMVTEIKRGKGWSRVTVIDESGVATVFADENTQIKAGQQYLLLMAANSIVRYIDVREIKDMQNDVLIKYLSKSEINIDSGRHVAIASSMRKTKAGKLMGTFVFADHLGHLHGAIAFPGNFHKVNSVAKAGAVVEVEFGTLDDETLFIKGVDNGRRNTNKRNANYVR